MDFFGQIKRETQKAILFFDGIREVWLPKSKIRYTEPKKDKTTMVTVPEWMAKERKLIV